MTAEKQLAALKWVAGTFGLAIISLVIWGATITANVEQLRGEVDELWVNYNAELKAKEKYLEDFAAFKQEIKDLKKAAEAEQQNNFLKQLFKHQQNEEPKGN